ncbi:hypothetical protein QWZ13_05245 [Reinekea marina]|uniref:hypothetical protein n=1 Tax=Reinekea marina TaxID=1310421 RepID=UPI0025B46B78|nr:hypothetical protein [Reinekea marina]MDN3648311.1 hypothetical protein [Reinekea marina]
MVNTSRIRLSLNKRVPINRLTALIWLKKDLYSAFFKAKGNNNRSLRCQASSNRLS